MSTKHLTTGSVEPPRVKGLLRLYLYSMTYCPYAERTRLVLRAKGIPHDIVNIDLMKKPEWYFKIHPEGKIPALLDGDKVVIESQDISEYLDEKYPENALYPADPEAKRKDRELIQKIAPVMDVFSKILFSNEEKTPEEWAEEFLPHLQVFEDELAKRGTPFFGGDKPGMVDYMLWPCSERRGAIWLKLGTKLPYKEHQLTRVDKWQETMTEQAIVAEIATPPETKLVEARLKGITVDNENL